MSLVFLGHAQIVSRDDEDNYYTHDAESWLRLSNDERLLRLAPVLHSARRSFAVPEIIVLSLYDRLPKKEVKFTRQNIFLRDRHTCQYCGKVFDPKDLNLDHVIPRDKGGRTTWENVTTSCIRCNTKKGNKLPQDARMIPLNVPRAPRWRPFHSSFRHTAAHESWRNFLDLENQAVEISA